MTVLMDSSEETAFALRTSLPVGGCSSDLLHTGVATNVSCLMFACISSAGPEKGLFDDITDEEVLVLQQMFFGVVICALATLAAKGDMVFTAIFIGGVAAMAGYWLTEKGDHMLDGFLKGRTTP